MEILKKFFRATPDDWTFKLMGPSHIIFIAICMLASVLMWKNKEKFKGKKAVRIMLIVTLCIQVFSLYTWYYVTRYKWLTESLPLYNCRVTIIFIIIALIWKNKLAQNIACYWGLLGCVIAVLMPSMDPFSPLHFTHGSYFIGHLGMLLSTIFILGVDRPSFDVQSLKMMLRFSLIFHVGVGFINYKIGANYCYIYENPFFDLRFAHNGTIAYSIFAIFAHLIMVLLAHILILALQSRLRLTRAIEN